MRSPPRRAATIGSWTERSQAPAALLANDPHRAILLPSLRYIVHLVGPGWNVIEAVSRRCPAVRLIQRRIGFGITIFGLDQQDLYVEETNPGTRMNTEGKDAGKRCGLNASV